MAKQKVTIPVVGKIDTLSSDTEMTAYSLTSSADGRKLLVNVGDELISIFINDKYHVTSRSNEDDKYGFSISELSNDRKSKLKVQKDVGGVSKSKIWEITTSSVEIEVEDGVVPPVDIGDPCHVDTPPATNLWPITWSVTPKKHNWKGSITDSLSFSVVAIPDPDFPTWWDANMVDPITGIIPPLPPMPSIEGVEVLEHTLFNNDYISVSNTTGNNYGNDDTLSVLVQDARILQPFQAIKFEKDEEQYTVQYEYELEEIGYDFVYSFVPNSSPYTEQHVKAKALSSSGHVLCGTFYFRVDNDYDSIRDTLKKIVNNANQDAVSAEGDGLPEDFESSGENETEVTIPEFQDSYEAPDEDDYNY